jgi:hypothetical protein
LQHNRVRLRANGLELNTGEDYPNDFRHLGLGESGANTTADATTEGKPGVGLGAVVEEALGTKLIRLWVEVLAAMD